MQKSHFQQFIEDVFPNISVAARKLGCARATLYNFLESGVSEQYAYKIDHLTGGKYPAHLLNEKCLQRGALIS